jgi:hypothetical protein
MQELLRFLKNYEVWIYVVVGLIALLYFRRVVRAWQEWRNSLFGIERENAQRRFSTYLTLVILLTFLVLTEFTVVTFIVPVYPLDKEIIPTPTIDLNITPTVSTESTNNNITATPDLTAAPTAVTKLAVGCTPGQIEWTFPKAGGEISGKVDLKGTVNVPNLGFYKYEFSQAGVENWLTIAAGNENNKVDAVLGTWDTTLLIPGDYQLRLVVADNQNQLMPACVIPIRIIAPK